MKYLKTLFLITGISFFTIACGGGGSSGDSTDTTPNNTPVANAETDQNVSTGSLVMLDGSGSSDADSDTLTYSWSITSMPTGSTATLSYTTIVNPTFTADVEGTYVISLRVNDGTVDSAPDYVIVTAIVSFNLPDTGQTQSYTDTFGEDSDYTITPPSYTDNGDGTITDNVTELMWQKEDDNTKRSWTAAITYCDNLSLSGYSDWRLPAIKELQTIVNYGTNSPSIDITYFPNTNYSNDGLSDYWSVTDYAFDNDFAWGGDFRLGNTTYHYKLSFSSLYTRFVRCVRGDELSFGYFNDNGDDTITDVGTGLMWQKTEDGEMKWIPALEYCENLFLAGHDDWRLPNIKELESITDYTNHHPAINTNYFPDTGSHSNYWTSTILDAFTTYAWYVGYEGGGSNATDISTNYHVRCVR